MNNLLILLIYIPVFLTIRLIYKNHIEKKYNYKIPTKKSFGIDRTTIHYDEEVIHNKKLAKEISTLFIVEIIGVFLMFGFSIYLILS